MNKKYLYANTYAIIIVLAIFCCVGCVNKITSTSKVVDTKKLSFNTIDINLSSEFYDSVYNKILSTNIIVLKESDEIMFADFDKVIASENLFYIMDSFGARTVVSFNQDGNAIARYGKIGQGPGEYVRPWDIAITPGFVYILDSNSKKIIKYGKDGTFVKEYTVPFLAKGFKILDNGEFIFSLLPDGHASPRLCITDSLITRTDFYLPSLEGYAGGWLTTDIFRNYQNSGIDYYQAPLDTLYHLSNDGTLVGGLIFNFGKRKVSVEAQKDYLAAKENGKLINTLMLANNPIKLHDNLMIGTIVGTDSQYTVLFDPVNNKSGVWNCSQTKSIYDIIEPMTLDDKGNLVCYTELEYIEDAPDFDSLDTQTKEALRDNNHILMLYKFSK